MTEWFAKIAASRPPDFVIGGHDNPYLRRWWLIPRNEHGNVYLHEFLRSDDDRALHDHPWRSTSILLAGQYVEHTPDGTSLRRVGDIVQREATALHRIELTHGPAWSLFLTGPRIREWGFACPQGWRPWQEFVGTRDKGSIGRGCD